MSERIALVFRGIVQDHPFVDGNKRTGLAILETVVRRNGFSFHSTNLAALEFVLGTARGEFDVVGIAQWIRSHIRKV